MDQKTIEEQSLELSKLYEEYYNSDIEKFAEIYAADCEINGGVYRGRDNLRKSEKAFLEYSPNRKMRVDKRHEVGNVVITQGVILDPDRGADWQVPFCAVLTCQDGKIASDFTYAEFSRLRKEK